VNTSATTKKILFLLLVALIIIGALPQNSHGSSTTITRTFSSLAEDGYIEANNATYSTAWNAMNGNGISSTSTDIYCGQMHGYFGVNFWILPSFLYFDTSLVPIGATVTNATLSLNIFSSAPALNFNVTVQSGEPNFPHKPMILSDYFHGLYFGNGGQRSTSTISGSGYWNITLNTQGKTMIEPSGITKLCLRSDKDISETPPLYTAEFIKFYSYEEGQDYSPRLYVTYTTSGYSVFLHGAFSEEGVRDGAINVTYNNLVNSSVTFSLNGDLTISSEATTGILHFAVTSDVSRTYYINQRSEDIYVFKPEGQLVTDYFTIYDLVGVHNGYLESLINVNGTKRVVECWKILQGTMPFVFQVGSAYTMELICDEGTYIYGDYIATGTSQSYPLTVTNAMFPPRIVSTYKYVRIYASRTFGDHNIGEIAVHYQDLLNETESVSMRLSYLNGSVVASFTQTGSNWTYIFSNVANNVDYIFDATVSHYQIGTMQWRQLLYHQFAGTQSPFSLDFFGTWPIISSYIVPLFLILLLAGTFSTLNRELAAFVAVVAAIFFSAMQWLPLPAGALVAAVSFVILLALLHGKKGDIML
jgi:hypothetical protein